MNDHQKMPLNDSIFSELINNLLSNLSERSRKIIRVRFGLEGDKGETLEKIGHRYSITRERVRQIIGEGMKNILAQSNNENLLKAEKQMIFTINQNNGIIKKSEVIEKFNSNGEKEANAIKFFADCSRNIFLVEDKGNISKSWVVSKDIVKEVKKVIADAENLFHKERKLLADQEILLKLAKLNPTLSESQILDFLKVSCRLKKNKFGKWGLIHWMEVSPKRTRERVYLVLKERGKPLHFTQIAELIDKYQLGKRKAHPQTVHNELIKDDRFVLIGRGIYALAEWGYFKGTIREVLKKILEKNRQPMDKNKIIDEVLKVRKMKMTTVMINLNNSKIFQRKGNLYMIKK